MAVGEGDVRAQLDGVFRAVVRPRPAFGEPGSRLAGGPVHADSSAPVVRTATRSRRPVVLWHWEKDWGSVLTEAMTWPPRAERAALPRSGSAGDPDGTTAASRAAKPRMRATRVCLKAGPAANPLAGHVCTQTLGDLIFRATTREFDGLCIELWPSFWPDSRMGSSFRSSTCAPTKLRRFNQLADELPREAFDAELAPMVPYPRTIARQAGADLQSRRNPRGQTVMNLDAARRKAIWTLVSAGAFHSITRRSCWA